MIPCLKFLVLGLELHLNQPPAQRNRTATANDDNAGLEAQMWRRPLRARVLVLQVHPKIGDRGKNVAIESTTTWSGRKSSISHGRHPRTTKNYQRTSTVVERQQIAGTAHDAGHVVTTSQDGGRAHSTNGGQHDRLVRDVNEAVLGTARVCRVTIHVYEQRPVDHTPNRGVAQAITSLTLFLVLLIQFSATPQGLHHPPAISSVLQFVESAARRPSGWAPPRHWPSTTDN